MSNMNLYSRGDKFFVRINMVLVGLFTLATLYPFIYIAAVSFSSGMVARSGLEFLPQHLLLYHRRHHYEPAAGYSGGLCFITPPAGGAALLESDGRFHHVV